MQADTERFGIKGYNKVPGYRVCLVAAAHLLVPDTFTALCGVECDQRQFIKLLDKFEKRCKRCERKANADSSV